MKKKKKEKAELEIPLVLKGNRMETTNTNKKKE